MRQPEVAFPDPLRECSGRTVALRLSGVDGQAKLYEVQASRLPRREVTDADITFSTAEGGRVLLWARTDYFDNQTAIGPVALVQLVDRGVEVRGIGTLLAPHKKVQLHLEDFGDDAKVLVASGEVCADEQLKCTKETYLAPLTGQRFIQASMVIDGHEGGPAKISGYERVEHPTDEAGMMNRDEVDRVFEIKGQDVLISETVTILECDTAVTPTECQEYKSTRHSRTMRWEGSYFSSTPGVWERMDGH